MLCRNARHSWEAGNPLVELARSVSEGPVSLGRANHGGCSRRLACRVGFRKARALVWAGRPQPELVRRSKIPHGLEAILPRTPESRRWTS